MLRLSLTNSWFQPPSELSLTLSPRPECPAGYWIAPLSLKSASFCIFYIGERHTVYPVIQARNLGHRSLSHLPRANGCCGMQLVCLFQSSGNKWGHLTTCGSTHKSWEQSSGGTHASSNLSYIIYILFSRLPTERRELQGPRRGQSHRCKEPGSLNDSMELCNSQN